MSRDYHSVLTAIFNRRGGIGIFTRTLELLGLREHATFGQDVVLEMDELPVVMSEPTVGIWLLITTKHVIYGVNGFIELINHQDILQVSIDSRADNSVHNPKTFQFFYVESRDGKRYRMQTEPEAPFWGIYTILKHIVTKNA